MKKLIFAAVIHILVVAVSAAHARTAQPFLDFEGGMVFTQYNVAKVPGDIGTRLTLQGTLNSSYSFFFRLRGGITLWDRHTISFLYAPLRLTSDGFLTRDVLFHRGVFQALTFVEARFRFDSYRLTYRYDFIKTDDLIIGAGFTGKIRSASIRLHNSAGWSERSDLGFVPLINFRAQWTFFDPFSLIIDADALWAPQGRAEDIMVALQTKLNQFVTMRVGYRMLEGGADNDSVYTFSMFHYALFGFTYTY